MATEKSLEVSREGDVLTITIVREKQLNALSGPVLMELREVFADVRAACDRESFSGHRVIILRGAGDKAFVAGADITSLFEAAGPIGDTIKATEFIALGHEVMHAIETVPVPVIAVIQGYAMGGGLELALSCDLIVGSKNAKVGLPEIGLGIIPGFGGTQRLARRTGIGTARKMILTGEPISADLAYHVGIFDSCVDRENLLEEVKRITSVLLSRSPLALKSAKRALAAAEHHSKSEGLRAEEQLFLSVLQTEDALEGLRAFREKREPRFRGK